MKSSNSRSGVVDPITLIVLVVVGLGAAVPASRPWNWFKKGPAEQSATAAEQVKKLEADRAAAQARADTLQAEKEAASARAQKLRDKQLVQAQELTYGAATELSRVTAPSAQVRTASTLLQHALVYQSLALGDLNAEQKAEVIRLIDLASAGREAEFREALAKKDAEVAEAQRGKQQALAAVDVANRDLTQVKGHVATLTHTLGTKIDETVTLTGKASAEEQKANSFSTQFSRLVRWIIYAAIAYGLIVFVLPIVAMAFPKLKSLGSLSGWLVAPFHQMDNRKKETLAADLVGAHEDAKNWVEKKLGTSAREEFKKDVLAGWVTVHDGTAEAVARLKNSKLFKSRQDQP
jgi:hypothetical protein